MTEPGGLRLANGIRRFFAAMSRRRPSFIRSPRRESSLNQGAKEKEREEIHRRCRCVRFYRCCARC
jgi:hypothetical protein